MLEYRAEGLCRNANHLTEEELARTLKRLGPVSDEVREALDVMAKALVRKMNHDPIIFLKEGTGSHEGSASRISLMRRIFNLDSGTCSRATPREKG